MLVHWNQTGAVLDEIRIYGCTPCRSLSMLRSSAGSRTFHHRLRMFRRKPSAVLTRTLNPAGEGWRRFLNWLHICLRCRFRPLAAHEAAQNVGGILRFSKGRRIREPSTTPLQVGFSAIYSEVPCLLERHLLANPICSSLILVPLFSRRWITRAVVNLKVVPVRRLYLDVTGVASGAVASDQNGDSLNPSINPDAGSTCAVPYSISLPFSSRAPSGKKQSTGFPL
jgi:hypothetical protein